MAAEASQKCALLFLRQMKKKQLMPTRLILLSDLWRAKSGDGKDRCEFSECFRISWAPSGIDNLGMDIAYFGGCSIGEESRIFEPRARLFHSRLSTLKDLNIFDPEAVCCFSLVSCGLIVAAQMRRDYSMP